MADLRLKELILLGVGLTLLRGTCVMGTDFPPGWHKLCRRDVNFVSQYTEISLNWTQPIIQISCSIRSADDVLRLTDFRRWSGSQNSAIALKAVCENPHDGSFQLPWPMKAENLVFLQIRGCRINDYYSEHLSDHILTIRDSIRVLDIRDSLISYKASDVSTMIEHFSRISSDAKCGPLTMEAYVFSNATLDLDMEVDWNNTEAPTALFDPVEYGTQLYTEKEEVTHKCKYQFLRLLDQSYFQNMDARHFYNLMFNNIYPVLQVYNVSNANLVSLPEELRRWRLKFPKMEYLDLSYNNISSFKFTDMGSMANGRGIIDLRYNNISQLRGEDITVLQDLKTATIDLRNNPWSCTCGSNEYLYEYLHQHPNLSAVGLGGYENLTRDLICASPPSLAGQPLYTLSQEQVYCQNELDPSIKIVVVVFSVTVVIFGVIVLLFLRYRQEILILAYTRLNIVFPCGKSGVREDKPFDAFISYSSKDDDWVLKTFVKRLENFQQNSLKLCLHHRDFEVGAAIADNVVRCVESSRHTVIVLSKNFIESEWCIYEFRTAMHQSLLERRKHLVVVLLEDLAKEELDADLRKCLETYTYIQVRDQMFWDKILHTLSRGYNNSKRTANPPKQPATDAEHRDDEEV